VTVVFGLCETVVVFVCSVVRVTAGRCVVALVLVDEPNLLQPGVQIAKASSMVPTKILFMSMLLCERVFVPLSLRFENNSQNIHQQVASGYHSPAASTCIAVCVPIVMARRRQGTNFALQWRLEPGD
jgi:hypothetical protein